MKRRFPAISKVRRHSPPLRLALTFVALLAFVFQSYVAQTHIHMTGQSLSITASADAKTAPQSKPAKFPANQDPANCPICQELLHSGSFITPSAVAALLPMLAVSVVAVVLETTIAPQAVSHSWRGRAPPHI